MLMMAVWHRFGPRITDFLCVILFEDFVYPFSTITIFFLQAALPERPDGPNLRFGFGSAVARGCGGGLRPRRFFY